MAELNKGPASSAQTFEIIIRKKAIYVDKTSYLANLLSDDNKVWFLARPHRFGKSLTVSTLKAVFSEEKRELFKGLDIESRLSEARFAPRPVIHLDMSGPTDDDTLEVLKRTLGEMIIDIAENQDITLDPTLPPKSLLAKLIKRSVKNSKRKVAILIDEYDSPLIAFKRRSEEEYDKLVESLRNFFKILKSLDEYISFIFITGITRSLQFDLFSVLNTFSDISANPQFGAMCGFTQEELEDKFAHHIKRTATTLKMSEKELVTKMADYYNGFSFDGITRLYNPFSTLRFFQDQIFSNYWFDTGTSILPLNLLKKQPLTVEAFRGLEVSADFPRIPGKLTPNNPVSFLYQTGYLALRPGAEAGEFTLDFPNHEVLTSMSILVVEDILGELAISAVFQDTKKALINGDAAALIKAFNQFFAKFPYDDYGAAKTKSEKKSNGEKEEEANEKKEDVSDAEKITNRESLFRSRLLSLLYCAIDLVFAEIHSSRGRSDIVAQSGKWTWVMELKVCLKKSEEQTTLNKARTQMIEKRYAAGFENPICLGIVINNETRAIARWDNFGDLAKEYEAKQNRSPKKRLKSESPKD
ncbi:MAG: ATP-binding protein [Deltaproteobacteria bacterium]|jgi:hypothetical protein|nr:ATP-binding protein [Deltaproteobacteria bacterium]